MSQVFFDELDLPEPRYRLDLRTADPVAMTPPIREAVERERPDWVVVLGDTNTTLAGRARRRRGGARRARRGGPSQLRPDDAGGAKPHRGRPTVGAAVLPRRALGAAARARGRARPPRGRRRRDGRRDPPLRADRPAADGALRGAVLRADDPSRGERRSRSDCARSPPPSTTPPGSFVFPIHPRTRRVLQRTAHRPRPRRSS